MSRDYIDDPIAERLERIADALESIDYLLGELLTKPKEDERHTTNRRPRNINERVVSSSIRNECQTSDLLE